MFHKHLLNKLLLKCTVGLQRGKSGRQLRKKYVEEVISAMALVERCDGRVRR